MNALLIYLFCLAFGSSCIFIPDANVTVYAPELGGHNCQEPCDKTAYQEPLQYGIGAACGLSIGYGTEVYIEGVGWRICNDHGGSIDNSEVDILIRASEYPSWMSGKRDVIWVLDNK